MKLVLSFGYFLTIFTLHFLTKIIIKSQSPFLTWLLCGPSFVQFLQIGSSQDSQKYTNSVPWCTHILVSLKQTNNKYFISLQNYSAKKTKNFISPPNYFLFLFYHTQSMVQDLDQLQSILEVTVAIVVVVMVSVKESIEPLHLLQVAQKQQLVKIFQLIQITSTQI